MVRVNIQQFMLTRTSPPAGGAGASAGSSSRVRIPWLSISMTGNRATRSAVRFPSVISELRQKAATPASPSRWRLRHACTG